MLMPPTPSPSFPAERLRICYLHLNVFSTSVIKCDGWFVPKSADKWEGAFLDGKRNVLVSQLNWYKWDTNECFCLPQDVERLFLDFRGKLRSLHLEELEMVHLKLKRTYALKLEES